MPHSTVSKLMGLLLGLTLVFGATVLLTHGAGFPQPVVRKPLRRRRKCRRPNRRGGTSDYAGAETCKDLSRGHL